MMTPAAKALLFLSLGISSVFSHAEDWPRWRGTEMNGISKETDWKTQWPVEGPRRVWKAAVGIGFSSVSVGNGRLYTVGNDGHETDTVWCFDAATGAAVWKHPYHCVLDPKYYEGGPSCTPTLDDDRVYTLSRQGDLFCLDAANGNVIWTKNVHGELGNEIPTWGFAGSPLVEGDLVILDVGTAGTAFDKKTGKLAWASGKGASGYSSPVLFKSGDRRLVAILAAEALEVVNPADGRSVWRFPWKTQYDVNAADPVISGGRAFVSAGYGHGCALLDISHGQPSLLWQNKNMRNHFNSSILWNGYLYGVDENELKCLNWDSGEVKWSEPKFGKGSLILADGKIIGLSEKGELMVAEASPEGFMPLARAQVLGGKCWTSPVLSNGRIYCRNAAGNLVCLDVGGK